MDRGACQATVHGITKSWDTSEAAEHAHMWKKKKKNFDFYLKTYTK